MSEKMKSRDREFIKEASQYLEHPSFLVRAADMLGKPLEAGLARLPQKAQQKIAEVSQASLTKALGYATNSISKSKTGSFVQGQQNLSGTDTRHVVMTGVSGAVGGFFGLVSLPLELPITTVMMLRSIAAIADDYGLDIDDPYVQMDCISVFSLGASSSADDELNSAYYSSRVALARLIDEAAAFVAKKTTQEVAQALSGKSAPMLVRFITVVASRFEIVITEKMAAQSIPIIGAISGALLNSAFTGHFNSVARYHFGLKALEKEYGMIQIRSEYLKHSDKN